MTAALQPRQRLAKLVAAYLSDPESPFAELEYVTSGNYVRVCRRITADHGGENTPRIVKVAVQVWEAFPKPADIT